MISRQIDRVTSEQETQAARAHARECPACRRRFNAMAGADRLLAKTLLAERLSDGFTAIVAERLAQADLAEISKGISKGLIAAAAGLGALIVVLLTLLMSSSEQGIPGIGRVGRVESGFELCCFRSKSFLSASMGEKVPRGASARTDGGGVLKLDGGRNFVLGQDTAVDMSHYHDGGKLVLEEGRLYVSSPDTDVQVDTFIAKVYGKKASFVVEHAGGGRTTVAVESGEVSLFNEAGAVTIATGEKSQVAEGKAPRNPSKTDVKKYFGWVRRWGF